MQVCLRGLNLGPARLIFDLAGFLRAVQLLCFAAKGSGHLIESGAACLNRKVGLGQLLHSDWHVLIKP